MKMIYCTCNTSVLDALLTKLEAINVKDYQVVDHVIAKSVKGDPRLDTAVWPGYNASVFLQFHEDEKAKEVIRKLRDFNKNAHNESELITCCSWTIDDYFYGESFINNED